MDPHHGLEWREAPKVDDNYGYKPFNPYWTVDPDYGVMASIVRRHLQLKRDTRCEFPVVASFSFHKLYNVEIETGEFWMAITLPVYPVYKTKSEVATMTFIKHNTTIPVPKILAFDASNDNELGFEWILMEKPTGLPLSFKWPSLPWNMKEDLIACLADYQAQLFRIRFAGIGSILEYSAEQNDVQQSVEEISGTHGDPISSQEFKSGPALGQMVSLESCWKNRISLEINRGPFRSGQEWLNAQLSILVVERKRFRKNNLDMDSDDEGFFTPTFLDKLVDLLPLAVPEESTLPESSVLSIHDLDFTNILIDDSGKITAIIDWEFVSVVPLWSACQFPAILESVVRNEKPDRASYPLVEPKNDASNAAYTFDDERMPEEYWQDMVDYDRTMLRPFFFDTMMKLESRWIDAAVKGESKLMFARDIEWLGNKPYTKRTNNWVDENQNKENWMLPENMRNVLDSETERFLETEEHFSEIAALARARNAMEEMTGLAKALSVTAVSEEDPTAGNKNGDQEELRLGIVV